MSQDTEKFAAVSEAARLLVSQRRRVAGQCEYCGRLFTGPAYRKLCSGICRSMAYQRRVTERERADVLA